MNGIQKHVTMTAAVLSLAGTVYGVGFKMGGMQRDLDRVKADVALITDLYIKDVVREKLKTGLFETHSPVVLSDSLLIAMRARPEWPKIVGAFVSFLEQNTIPADDGTLAALVVQRLGESIVGKAKATQAELMDAGMKMVAMRADLLQVAPSDYLAIWIVSVREAKRSGLRPFLRKLGLSEAQADSTIKSHPGVEHKK
jgi:hypothetical protein